MSSIHARENIYDARVDVDVDAWMVQGTVHIVGVDFTCQEAKNEVERNIFQGRQLWIHDEGSLLKLGPVDEQEVECQRPGMIEQCEEHAMAYFYPCGLPFWILYFMPAREIRKENVY